MNKSDMVKVVAPNGMVFVVAPTKVKSLNKTLKKAQEFHAKRAEYREEKAREFYLRVRARYEAALAKRGQLE